MKKGLLAARLILTYARHKTYLSPFSQYLHPLVFAPVHRITPLWIPKCFGIRNFSSSSKPDTLSCEVLTAHDSKSFNDVTDKEFTTPGYFETVPEEQAKHILETLGPDEARMLKILHLEYEAYQSTGANVPDNMTSVRWLQLLKTKKTTLSRVKKYKYWRKLENYEKKNRVDKERKSEVYEERLTRIRNQIIAAEAKGESAYKNSIVMRIRDSTMNMHFYNNLAHAMMFGPEIIIDLSWAPEMEMRAFNSMIMQLGHVHARNKEDPQPYHLILCNVNKDPRTPHGLEQLFGGKRLEGIPITVTDEHYTSLYPKEQLVYLSPNGAETLETLSPDDVYILGGMVDIAEEKPWTYARAEEEGIRSAKLPLDKYLWWKAGSKSLTLDAMIQILLTFKMTNSWTKAFKHVPRKRVRKEYAD